MSTSEVLRHARVCSCAFCVPQLRQPGVRGVRDVPQPKLGGGSVASSYYSVAPSVQRVPPPLGAPPLRRPAPHCRSNRPIAGNGQWTAPAVATRKVANFRAPPPRDIAGSWPAPFRRPSCKRRPPAPDRDCATPSPCRSRPARSSSSAEFCDRNNSSSHSSPR